MGEVSLPYFDTRLKSLIFSKHLVSLPCSQSNVVIYEWLAWGLDDIKPLGLEVDISHTSANLCPLLSGNGGRSSNILTFFTNSDNTRRKKSLNTCKLALLCGKPQLNSYLLLGKSRKHFIPTIGSWICIHVALNLIFWESSGTHLIDWFIHSFLRTSAPDWWFLFLLHLLPSSQVKMRLDLSFL